MSKTIEEMQKLIAELEKAKGYVQTMLDRPNVRCDMHGIQYWAGRVEKLREEIRENL